jgi:hypothetical protein
MTMPLWYSLTLSVALATAAAGWAGLACWGVAALARRGRWDAMITDFLLTAGAIVAFSSWPNLAWRPFQRRHIDRPLPTDPAAQAANIGGIIGGGCVVLAFVAVVAVALLAVLLLALEP